MSSSFNAFGSRASEIGGSRPVWLGTPTPVPVGGTLASAYAKKGILIPAGTPVNLASKVITPYLTYAVTAVTGSVTGITIDPKAYGYVPQVGDYLFLVNKTDFSNNGTPVAITAVAANATDASLLDVTIALTGATVGSVVALAFASTAAPVPNGYLWNDIFLGDLESDLAATGAVIEHAPDGILIDLTPAADIKAAMKAAVPGVYQFTNA